MSLPSWVTMSSLSDEELYNLFEASGDHEFRNPSLVKSTNVRQIASDVVMKIRRSDDSDSEAKTMHLVREATTILVPTIRRNFIYRGVSAIIMDFIPGQTLADCWHSLGYWRRFWVLYTIRRYIRELRRVEVPGIPRREQFPGRIGHEPQLCYGPMFSDYGDGPFASYDELTAWFAHKLDVNRQIRGTPKEDLRFDSSLPLVLTHLDLHPRNIILDLPKMPFYPFHTAINSSVFGGSWSTPYGTRFFVPWGDRSLKVPMDALREEYEAWEKLRRERHPEPEPEPEPPKPAPLPSLPSGPFDWADDVEQEFFSSPSSSDSDDDSTNDMPSKPSPLLSFPSGSFDWADDVEQEFFSSPSSSDSDDGSTDDSDTGLDIDLDNKPDTDLVDSPIVDQVVAEGVGAVGTGTTLCTIPEEDEEEDVTEEDEAGDFDTIDLSDSDSTSVDDYDATMLADITILADFDLAPMNDSDSTSVEDPTPMPLDDPASSTASAASTDIPTTAYRILNIDTTGPNLSPSMVECDTTSDIKPDDPAATAKDLFDTIWQLLNTYPTVFNTAARACAAFLILLTTARW
ncbi:hypothetical protein GSI_07206 [Ganoderma sinense ZZ0214-1]|uniref:Aminoglycoside phosphotransferase domain-containing protein n=1 Tax=Ganoderma sinense ZZ0214-1 TaxID=1077348 RepID=A0A2G8S9R7_9APHY|nr:hypothetical protein GSI_07206 [Ganoderma sinense ZZ0214-1]